MDMQLAVLLLNYHDLFRLTSISFQYLLLKKYQSSFIGTINGTPHPHPAHLESTWGKCSGMVNILTPDGGIGRGSDLQQ